MHYTIHTTFLDLAAVVYEAAVEEVADEELAEQLAMIALAGLLARATLDEPGASRRRSRGKLRFGRGKPVASSTTPLLREAS